MTAGSNISCRYCGRRTNDPERICEVCRRKRLLDPSPVRTLGDHVDEIKRLLEEVKAERPGEVGQSELVAALQQRVTTVELLFKLINI
jgi:hypothetical protein